MGHKGDEAAEVLGTMGEMKHLGHPRRLLLAYAVLGGYGAACLDGPLVP